LWPRPEAVFLGLVSKNSGLFLAREKLDVLTAGRKAPSGRMVID
jgi:hypothetical protein